MPKRGGQGFETQEAKSMTDAARIEQEAEWFRWIRDHATKEQGGNSDGLWQRWVIEAPLIGMHDTLTDVAAAAAVAEGNDTLDGRRPPSRRPV